MSNERDVALPELPEPVCTVAAGWANPERLPRFSPDQMHAYARAAIAQHRAQEAPAERWVVVCESVLDVGRGGDVRTGGRPELGYALLSHAATFASEDAARAALQEAKLPLGWVLMPLSRLLPDLATPHTKDATA